MARELHGSGITGGNTFGASAGRPLCSSEPSMLMMGSSMAEGMKRDKGRVDGTRGILDGAAAGRPIKSTYTGTKWTVGGAAAPGYAKVGGDGTLFAGSVGGSVGAPGRGVEGVRGNTFGAGAAGASVDLGGGTMVTSGSVHQMGRRAGHESEGMGRSIMHGAEVTGKPIYTGATFSTGGSGPRPDAVGNTGTSMQVKPLHENKNDRLHVTSSTTSISTCRVVRISFFRTSIVTCASFPRRP